MSQLTRRFMRLMVFFDLPTKTKIDKRAYILFRRFLLCDGYDMLQWSVYSRIINGLDAVEKHLKRLTSNAPSKGSVRCLSITEKQFVGMKVLAGKISFQEKTINSRQLLLF